MKYKKIVLFILLLFIGIYIVFIQSEVDGSYKSEKESSISKKLKIEIIQSNEADSNITFFTTENNETSDNIDYFREYIQGERKLGRVAEIQENWFSYPPIILSDAANTLQNKYPDVVINHISGYYYIEDGEIPYHLFQSSDSNTTQYYLVSAYDKHIIIKKMRKPKSISEDPVPGWINSKGYLEINETLASKFSDEEQVQLKKGADLTNQYIRDGVMKFDQDMNIIFDKRTDEDFENERILEEELEETIDEDYPVIQLMELNSTQYETFE